MSLTLYTDDGRMIVAEDGPPWQYTDEGFNTFLSTNSVPLRDWGFSSGGYGRLYESQPWVFVAVNKLVRQIARLPLKVYEEGSQSGEKKRVRSGRLYDAISKPAPGCGPVDLKQWLVFDLLVQGNSGLKKRRPSAGAPPVGFEPRDWRDVDWKDVDEDGFIDVWYGRGTGRDREVIRPENFVHLHWHSTKDGVGVSPLRPLATTLRVELAAQLYQESLFKNSARPSGAVKMPQGVVLDKDVRDEIRADINRLYAGPMNAGRPVLLPGGLEWVAMALNADEASLIDQRKLNREEVAAAYDMPPPLIGILDHATFSNITELHQMLYTTVLGPPLVLVEEIFKVQVIDGEPAFEGQWVEFDLKEVLRGDPIKEAAALKLAVQAGLLTINEARDILNLPRIDHPDADRPMVPTNNMSFIGDEPASADDASALELETGKAIAALAKFSPRFAVAARAALNGHHAEE